MVSVGILGYVRVFCEGKKKSASIKCFSEMAEQAVEGRTVKSR